MEYKEKLRLAKEALDSGSYDKETIEYIFPELAESEDENIRKELLSFIQNRADNFPNDPKYRNIDKWIAWLKKQGEEKSIWHNEDEEPKRDSLILLIMQSGTPIVAKIIEPNHTFNHGERWAYIDDLLEKQGEKQEDPRWKFLNDLLIADDIHQMSVNEEMTIEAKTKAIEALSKLGISKLLGIEKQGEQPRYSIGDVLCDKSCTTLNKDTQPNFEIIDIRNGMYICDKGSFPISQQDEYELVAKKIDHKTTDKVVPKFQNGQWIVWQNKCYKVNYNGCGYELIDQNGLSTSLEYGTVDASARLWDITKDVRDGDVLAAEPFEDYPFPFIAICKECGLNSFSSYCYVSMDGEFIKEGGLTHSIEDCHPATKSQRDILFAKMKESGYEWSEETHELKEIKQKSARSEEDMKEALRTEYEKGSADAIAEIGGNFIEDDSEEFDIAIETLKEAGQFSSAKWLESIKDRILPKHEWRDEDENGLGDALWAIKQARTIAKDENDMGNLWYAENWLNSIKNRIQPKQEWSEEDDSMICELIHYLNYRNEQGDFHADLIRDWVVSLKDRIQPVEMKEILRTEYEKGRADTIAEMKSSWSEEDEKRIKKVTHILSLDGRISNEELKSILDWLKSLRPQKQWKSEWSEEDEYMLNETIQHLDELIRIDKAKHCACDVQYYQRDIDWLKSLKDRVQPQQKWSKEDKDMVENILGTYKTFEDMLDLSTGQDQDILISMNFEKDWLKQLKQRHTWKPSEEQMSTLNLVVSDYYHACTKESDKKAIVLKSILEQLKQL